MTKRFLITSTILFAVILSLAEPLFAQGDRQTGDSRTPIDRQQDQRAVETRRNVQQLRAEINSLFDEADATFDFFARYSIAQDSIQKLGNENFAEALKRLAEIRAEITSYSDNSLLLLSESFPDSATMERLVATLRKVRTDAAYQESLNRAEKWFVSEKNRSSVADSGKAGIRSTLSAPAFTRPVCNFYNLTDFPSAVDIGIAKGVLLAIEIIINSLNPSLGNNAPNPAYFIAVIAKGITKAIVIGLDGARDAGLWCQDIAFYIQGAMTTDGLFIDAVLFPPSAGGYLEFLKDFMPAIIAKAQEKNVSINCANARLAEANNFYNQSKWADAYKKYREAYANIGAAGCQP